MSAHEKLGFLDSKSADTDDFKTPSSPSCKLVPLRRRNSSRIDDEEEMFIPDTILRPSTVNEGSRRSYSISSLDKDDLESSNDNVNSIKRISSLSTSTKRATVLQPLKSGWTSEVTSPTVNSRDRKHSIGSALDQQKNDVVSSPKPYTSRSGSSIIAGSSPRITSRRKIL